MIGVRRKAGSTPKPAPSDAPGITLDHLSPGVIYFRLHDNGNAGPRARAANATGAQVAVVDGTTPLTAGEADKVPQVFVSRTMGQLASTAMPAQVRLYARWQTQRRAGQPVVGALDGQGDLKRNPWGSPQHWHWAAGWIPEWFP